jgi:nicotinamidase-related amidase
MGERVWDPFLTEADKAHFAVEKPKLPYGFGLKAAVLSVDNYRAVVGDKPEPLMEGITEWPSNTGLAGWDALAQTEVLLAAARAAGLPLIHVTGMAFEDTGVHGWAARRRGLLGPVARDAAAQDRHDRRYDIVEQAAPAPGEVVLTKTAPSAFFGTPLMAHLALNHIDTLIVCGEAVSGCVRATVVDGCSYRLHMIVVEECVYDQHETLRAINLLDIDRKYGDVISLEATLAWIRHHPGGEAPAVKTSTPSAM